LQTVLFLAQKCFPQRNGTLCPHLHVLVSRAIKLKSLKDTLRIFFRHLSFFLQILFLSGHALIDRKNSSYLFIEVDDAHMLHRALKKNGKYLIKNILSEINSKQITI